MMRAQLPVYLISNDYGHFLVLLTQLWTNQLQLLELAAILHPQGAQDILVSSKSRS